MKGLMLLKYREIMPWGVYGRNILPATVAKRNLGKGRAAGAKGGYLRGKRGKKNAARTFRKAFKKTCWPQFYWARTPIKSKKQKEAHAVASFHPAS